ncbi:hypothetical protein AUP68_06954 [Ilyonectria robusta]
MEFLREESAISPYAKQYYGILKDMTAVIQNCHDQIAQQRRNSNKEYIDRLLDFRHDGSDMREPGQALTEDAPTTSQDLSFDNENTGFFLSAWDDVIMDNFEARHPETQEFPWQVRVNVGLTSKRPSRKNTQLVTLPDTFTVLSVALTISPRDIWGLSTSLSFSKE